METKKQAIKAYSRVIMDADISGSPLDLRLASALKKFGIVNHSVWVERHNGS